MKAKYETEIMKDKEVLLFIETAVENGLSIDEAIKDMRFVDTCLHMKKLSFSIGHEIRKTKRGHLRKGVMLHDEYMNLLQARVDNKF